MKAEVTLTKISHNGVPENRGTGNPRNEKLIAIFQI